MAIKVEVPADTYAVGFEEAEFRAENGIVLLPDAYAARIAHRDEWRVIARTEDEAKPLSRAKTRGAAAAE